MTRIESTHPADKRRTPDAASRTGRAATSGKNAARKNPRKRKSRAGRRRSSANAYLGSGSLLGSARDREHVREGNAAERARVEAMLANAPIAELPEVRDQAGATRAFESLELFTSLPSDSSDTRDSHGAHGIGSRGAAVAGARATAGLRAIGARDCPVCASTKIVSDEVASSGMLRLSECLNCDHRWTDRPHANATGRWAALGARMNRRSAFAAVSAG